VAVPHAEYSPKNFLIFSKKINDLFADFTNPAILQIPQHGQAQFGGKIVLGFVLGDLADQLLHGLAASAGDLAQGGIELRFQADGAGEAVDFGGPFTDLAAHVFPGVGPVFTTCHD
jgi:hypothetical protein